MEPQLQECGGGAAITRWSNCGGTGGGGVG